MSPTYPRAILLLSALLGVYAACPADPPGKPHLGESLDVPTVGSDRDVQLLGGLLDDPDYRVRERATHDIGLTHNPAAWAFIQQAGNDPQPAVRSAACHAAAELGGEPLETFLTQLLADKDPAVVRAAALAVQQRKLAALSDPLIARLESANPASQTLLNTLTALKTPAPGDRLADVLADRAERSLTLAALRNAALLEKPTDPLIEQLTALQTSDTPSLIRAAALEVLGRLAGPSESLSARVAKAAESTDWPMRRAAVRLAGVIEQPSRIMDALQDPAPQVRLAAIEQAWALKLQAGETLVLALMIDTPDERTHRTARRCLQTIATDALRKPLIERLSQLRQQLTASEKKKADLAEQMDQIARQKTTPKTTARQAELNASFEQITRVIIQAERNASSCCVLIGHIGGPAGQDALLATLGELPINSPVVGFAADALGQMNATAAVPALVKLLDQCRKNGYGFLVAMTQMRPGPPFSEEVTGQVIHALATLKATDAIEKILATARVNYMGQRLSTVADAGVQAVPLLMAAATRETLVAFIVDVIDDPSYGLTPRTRAALVAGELKLAPARKPLDVLLQSERPTRLTMQAAAWALQQITGQTHAVGQPKRKAGDWIIRSTID